MAWRWLLLGTLLIGMAGCGDDAPKKPKNRLVVANDGCVEFTLNKTHFRVAEEYFSGASRTSRYILESARLHALLPNFEGRDDSVNRHEFVDVLGVGRRIRFYLDKRGRVMTVPDIVARELSGDPSIRPWRHGPPYAFHHGLEYYRPPTLFADSVYLHRSKGVPIVEIRCAEETQAPSPGCQMQWDYDANIGVSIVFNRVYLPLWEEILSNVKSILNGTRGGCAGTGTIKP